MVITKLFYNFALNIGNVQNTYLLIKETSAKYHYLAYQNEAETDVPNAMVLPIATKFSIRSSDLGTLPKNAISDIWQYLNPSRSISRDLTSKSIVRLGSYNVVIVNKLDKSVFTKLEKLGITLEKDLYDFFQNHYKGFKFLFCLFAPKEGEEKHPITVMYEPMEARLFHLPLVDLHEKGVPKLDKMIYPHQKIIVEAKNNEPIEYDNDCSELIKDKTFVCLDLAKIGIRTNNCDLFIDVNSAKTDNAIDFIKSNVTACMPNQL